MVRAAILRKNAMTDETDLHSRIEALEKRLAKARGDLEGLDPERRKGLGKLLESMSEALDAHDRQDRG